MNLSKVSMRFLFIIVALVVTTFSIGKALAATSVTTPYEFGLNSYSWSPYTGQLWGSVYLEQLPNGDVRWATAPKGYDVKWNATNAQWIRNNDSSGRLSITFHSSADGYTGPWGGCDNTWEAAYWASSNFERAQYTLHDRNCYGSITNEARVFPESESTVLADYDYYGQVKYYNHGSNDRQVQINVDTYWNGESNYHTCYKVLSTSDIRSCY